MSKLSSGECSLHRLSFTGLNFVKKLLEPLLKAIRSLVVSRRLRIVLSAVAQHEIRIRSEGIDGGVFAILQFVFHGAHIYDFTGSAFPSRSGLYEARLTHGMLDDVVVVRYIFGFHRLQERPGQRIVLQLDEYRPHGRVHRIFGSVNRRHFRLHVHRPASLP